MDKYFMPFCLAHNAQCSGNVSLLHSKSSFIASLDDSRGKTTAGNCAVI